MSSRRRAPMPIPASLRTIPAPGDYRYDPRDRVHYSTPESERVEREQTDAVARTQAADATLAT